MYARTRTRTCTCTCLCIHIDMHVHVIHPSFRNIRRRGKVVEGETWPARTLPSCLSRGFARARAGGVFPARSKILFICSCTRTGTSSIRLPLKSRRAAPDSLSPAGIFHIEGIRGGEFMRIEGATIGKRARKAYVRSGGSGGGRARAMSLIFRGPLLFIFFF